MGQLARMRPAASVTPESTTFFRLINFNQLTPIDNLVGRYTINPIRHREARVVHAVELPPISQIVSNLLDFATDT